MALYRREKTGAGDYLDISMHDCALACLPNVLGPVFVEKRDLVLQHERSLGGAAFYQVYATRDGRHVVLGAQEPKFVRALLTEWQRPDLIELCLRGPGAHQRPVIDFLQSVFATRTQAEWVAWFEGRDIGFGPVNTLREAFADPHANARGMHLLDGDGGEHIGLPVRYAAEPGHPRFTWPAPGEQTVEVLRESGYDDAGIAALSEQGAFTAATAHSATER
jgi:crotonobetainyl-CoA:carnitine CoA-transferase CaiB-like acyl-CoA transferase